MDTDLQCTPFLYFIQDIVYKAVPGLQAREESKIREFYRLRNLPVPEGEAKAFKATPVTNGVKEEESSQAQEPVDKGADCNYHRDDTQVTYLTDYHYFSMLFSRVLGAELVLRSCN